jgi:hypothetical protein
MSREARVLTSGAQHPAHHADRAISRNGRMSLTSFEKLLGELEKAGVWEAQTDGTHDGLNEMITIRCGDRAHAARWRMERPHLNKSLRQVIANSIIYQELRALQQLKPEILRL